MAKNQRTYDHEYKAQAVELAQEMGSAAAARELGISEKEINRLKKENALLEEASAFFAASRLRSAKTSE